MARSLIGKHVRRVEDPNLLTGQATYVGNLRVAGLARVVFVRSPVAHARIEGIDISAAEASPAVLAVYTAANLGLAPIPMLAPLNPACARPLLAQDRVRYVGEAVAMVVAETLAAAMDAAELVEVDYDPLKSVVDPEAALAEDAPLQFPDLGSNLAVGLTGGSTPDPLAGAATVVRATLQNQRVAVVPMEGHAIAVVPGDDGDGHDLTVHVATQGPHNFAMMASFILGLDPASLRVITPDVGGAFGGKAIPPPENLAVIVAARLLDRPLTWIESRSENMLSMHGRGQVQWIEMGFDTGGHITGMHCRMLGDCGAYAGFLGSAALHPTRMMAQGVYNIPVIRYDGAAVLTNTTPMGAFRGVGRPEAAEFLDRMMDLAAAELRIDPVELRRRNLLPAFDSPYETAMGATQVVRPDGSVAIPMPAVVYDTGDYPKVLDEVVRLAGYDDLRAEQAARRAAGARWQLGIGVSVYVEISAGLGGGDYGAVEIHRDGTATIKVGTSSHGQGHATSFAMIVSDRLGIPMEDIRFVQSDTAAVPKGGGTGASRSLQIAGSALHLASEQILERAKEIAAAHLEASADDIVLHDDGRVGVAGVPARALSWSQLAVLSADGDGADAGTADGDAASLAAAVDFLFEAGGTYPFGAHLSVVEVDMETGKVIPVRHIAVDDCGRIINPMIVDGQLHGGIAQGIAQALWEQVVYDADGNPMTGNLADYAMPSAAELPSYETAFTETLTPLNPLGAKGIGESGTIGATPAVHNAVVDALSHLGVRHVDMPCTPQRVWQAIVAAESGKVAGERSLWREPPAIFDHLPVAAALAPDMSGGPDMSVGLL